jgi:general secretion pathway protein N
MAGYEMNPHHPYFRLAGAVAVAMAATFATGAPAHAQNSAGSGLRAELVPAPSRGSLPDGRVVSGNPLWGIPLTQLNNTRDRPIFSPSRRPPPPVVVNRPFVPVAAPPPPPPPPPPEHPSLALLGTIAGEGEGLALFMETTSQNVVRLRTGEAHEGWVLRSVHGREAKLEKNNRTETVTLPSPGGDEAGGETPDPPPVFRRPPPRR